MSVKRLDLSAGEMKPPVKMTNGWLRVDGYFTRTGVFPYRMDDGSIRRELRTPEEVFSKAALDSFALVPVTDEHPSEFLDDSNTGPLARGTTGEVINRQGDFVTGRLMISDRSLIEKLERKEARELSCGYTCDLDFTPGTTKAGEGYDAIQRNIRGNHVAVVAKGRAGPEARVRMDGAGISVLRTDPQAQPVKTDRAVSPPSQPEPQAMTFKRQIQNIDVEFSNEQSSQTFARFEKETLEASVKLQARLDAAVDAQSKAEAARDVAVAALAKKDEEIAALPAKLREEGKIRAHLETHAAAVLGKKVNLDKLDDTGVRLLVLEKLKIKIPETRVKDPVYVEARFDSAMEDVDSEEVEATVSQTRRALDPVENEDTDEDGDDEEERNDSSPFEMEEKARKAMLKDHANAYLETLKRHQSA